ncbi:PASTA domain-containing protein [Streptomyces albipurpureus]|uniref:PASTA domain-containing protein n=1 Tax=Streptomyces albipurpureus TaxID=2897419 RepID=A0ABT0UJ75_9ACTN|nr:hypothetical protein [Streptomyces sp. CWNU-1]MCM2387655.1 hypothetical protein [Streptomyces sp. CWNU-1]
MPTYPPPVGPPTPPNQFSGKQKATLGCGGALFLALVIGLIGSAVSPTPRTVTKSVPGPAVTKLVTVTVTPEVKAPATPTPSKKPTPVATTKVAATPAAKAVTTPAATPTPRKPAAPTPVAEIKSLPNLVGQQLQAAQDAAQAAGFYLLSSHDATGAGRMQLLDRNWKVCSQSPAPGSVDPSETVDFGAVKIEESCP